MLYCQVAICITRELSSNPELSEELIMNYSIAKSRKEKMLQFSENLPHTAKIEDTIEIRKAGFSDEDIWDIISGFFNMLIELLQEQR